MALTLKMLNRRFGVKLNLKKLLELVSRTDYIGETFRKRYGKAYVDSLVKIVQKESQKPFFTGSLVSVLDYENALREMKEVWEACPNYHPYDDKDMLKAACEMQGMVVS